MAFNSRMHPRNIYKNKKHDFKELASKYEDFGKEVTDEKGKIRLDFKNPTHVRALTCALLKDDFDLHVSIPYNRLVPTVPLRLNYILWIEDLLSKGTNSLRGIDLGCGPACIYSLLGAKKNSWSFLATEADQVSFDYALKNVQENDKSSSIKVIKVSSSSTLSSVLQNGSEASSSEYDFCMCNPPFFENDLDAWGIGKSRSGSRPEPKSVRTASDMESIYPGGEVEFVKKVMINPSLKFPTRVVVYTSMLGKKCSLKVLTSYLKENNIGNIGTTEFCQGNTMRWGLAWSFDANFSFPRFFQACQKQSSKITCVILNLKKTKSSIRELQTVTEDIFKNLKMEYSEEETDKFKCEMISWHVTASENTWIHQRRKRRRQIEEVEIEDGGPESKKSKLEIQTDETTCSVQNNEPHNNVGDIKNNGEECPVSNVAGEIEKVSRGVACSEPIDSKERVHEKIVDYILKLNVKLRNKNSIKSLEFIWEGGTSKELLHQVYQYFKNHFDKIEDL